MLLKSAIEHCYRSQQEQMLAADAGMLRDRKPGIIPVNEFVHIITGIRRCGKSTLLHQLMSSTGNKAAYFNFEDPRIHGFALEKVEILEIKFSGKIEWTSGQLIGSIDCSSAQF